MKTRVLILCCLFYAISAVAAVPEMEKLKAIYNTQMKRIASDYQGERLRAPQEHTSSMRELESSYQKSGDLKGLLAVRKERLRFVNNPRVSAIEPVTTPVRLRDLQQKYISRYSNMGTDNDTKTRDLHAKYLSALENLQIALTQKGKIESALAVMNEIEETKSGNAAASDKPTSAPAADPFSTPSAGRKSDILDLETLNGVLNGNVTRWNSYSREITVTYDFSEASQMEDWKGGVRDASRGIMLCENTVAWVRLQLLQVLKVEHDVHFEGYKHFKAGFLIGDSLQADLIGGDTLDANLFQTSSQHPVTRFSTAFDRRRTYRSALAFQQGRAEWSLNGGRTRRGTLQVPIRYPAYVGFGTMRSVSGYDNISITGILSKEYEAYLKQKL